MKVRLYIVFFLLLSVKVFSQDVVTDTIKNGADNDSIAMSYDLKEVVISNDTISAELKQQLSILRRRILRVYPYAKLAAERLTTLNATMDKLKTDKEKKRYTKIVEKYLEDEFEDRLKKLSRKDGQILVKLIYRQTGESVFDLVKEHKSGWKAFWSNKMAKLFNIDIKKGYSPATNAEDYYIEGILLDEFNKRHLPRQEPAFPIDYEAITRSWMEKINNEKKG